MIELIFAIVVMGIAMLSLPLMIDTATKSNRVAFNQESIAIIASHSNAIMSYNWDENNTLNSVVTGRNSMLVVTDGNAEIDANRTTIGRTRTLGGNTASLPSTFGKTSDVVPLTAAPEPKEDDVDDFHNQTRTLVLARAGEQIANKGDYMDKSISIRTTISYGSDDPTPDFATCVDATGCTFSQPFTGHELDTTNVKRIVTRLTSTNDNEKTILLKSFVCNIGFSQPRTAGSF